MSAPRTGLLDTSAVVLLERLSATDLPDRPVISAVTLAELSVGPLVTTDPAKQAVRQARLQSAEREFDTLPFDASAARAFGQVSSDLRRHGSKARRARIRRADCRHRDRKPAAHLHVQPCDFDGIENLTVNAIPQPDGN